jgi:ATP-dependent DNA helicase DinG
MTITNATTVSAAHEWVEAAYKHLEKQKDFVPRTQQLDLSKSVATAFISGDPLAAEAPTGTGKTLAYLIGALAANEFSPKKTREPVVVSTATKALQQQLVSTDLPRMAAAGLIKLSEVAVAKGKGNYLCLKHAEDSLDLLRRAESDPDTFVDAAFDTLGRAEIEPMVDAFLAGRWDGDFDAYEGRRPKSVYPIAVSSDTCLKKKCEHYKDCAYYKQRDGLTTAKIVVANHDLLLLDLLLTSQEIEPTLPIANYRVIFDEAHHLPEKAIRVGSHEANLTQLMQALPKLMGIQKIIKSSPELQKVLAPSGTTEKDFDQVPTAKVMRVLMGLLAEMAVDPETSVKRFSRGRLPVSLEPAVKDVYTELSKLTGSLGILCTALKDATLPPGPLTDKAGELMRRALDVKRPAQAVSECFAALVSAKRNASWLLKKDTTISLNTSPLEGADVLNRLLWTNKRAGSVVMVSATLQDLGGFDRFTRRAGLPASTQYQVLPYSFPYELSQLVVAGMSATPKFAERKMFLPELARKLPLALDPKEATLVLFPSWVMLKEFAPKLKSHFGASKVRVQGEQVPKMLVRDHCAAVNRGEGSILLGVATLSEGLDLPGKYCTHVVVVALPFAVPSDPVEQELAELLGNKYFGERSLPDAMVRLTQMVGRLLRRETDRGRVTVFDRRLASTSYGRQMLENLPPFEKIVEVVAVTS